MTYPWASLKPALYYLYVHKNLTLDQVRKKIEAEYGIIIQNRTYRQKFQEWEFRKSDHKEWRSRTRSRSSDRRVGARNAPLRNSPPPSSTVSAHPLGRAGRGALVHSGGKPLRRADSKRAHRLLSSNPYVAVSDDLDSAPQNGEQKLQVSMEGLNINAEFPGTSESVKPDLAPVTVTLPLTERSLRALTSSQTNARGIPAQSQVLKPGHSERTVLVHHRAHDMSQTPALTPLPICDACAVRINTPYVAREVFVKCTQAGCLYRGLDDMRVPSLSHSWTANLAPGSYPGSMPRFTVREQVKGDRYGTVQASTSGYNSSCPSFIQHGSLKEAQHADVVSGLPFQETIFHPLIEDLPLHYKDVPSMNSLGSTGNPSHFSHELQSLYTSPSLPDFQPHNSEFSSFSQGENHMSALPYVVENFSFPLSDGQAHDLGDHPVQQENDYQWQGGYSDVTQVMDMTRPQAFSYSDLSHDSSEAEAAAMVTPPTASYEIPWLNDFEFQDAVMATPQEDFGALSQPTPITEDDETYLALFGASAHSTSSLC